MQALSDLENTSTNSSINWIIIAYHQPAYISPNDCKACSPRVTLREVYHPLFDKYNVDLVLQAHSHNYERSYPRLYNNKDSETSVIVNPIKNNYNYDINKFHGTIFATVGTGGAECEEHITILRVHETKWDASISLDQVKSKSQITSFLDTKIITLENDPDKR